VVEQQRARAFVPLRPKDKPGRARPGFGSHSHGNQVVVRDALVVIDVITRFDHPGGDALLASFREHHPALVAALAAARTADVPLIYVNDNHGVWGWDIAAEIRRASDRAEGGELVARVAPRAGDRFLRKPRYSAFDHTALDLVLRELEVERLLLAGAATEMCIVQTAIDARELGLKVTILADACASVDQRDAELALAYAERVVGAHIDRRAVVSVG
jgi:nicotinamidase-related amidase